MGYSLSKGLVTRFSIIVQPDRALQSRTSWSRTFVRHEPGLCFSDIGNNTRGRPQWKWLRQYRFGCMGSPVESEHRHNLRQTQSAKSRNQESHGPVERKWRSLRALQVPSRSSIDSRLRTRRERCHPPAPRPDAAGCCSSTPATYRKRRHPERPADRLLRRGEARGRAPRSRRSRRPVRRYRHFSSACSLAQNHRHDLVIGIVKRRPQQVVHGGIDHDELLAVIPLAIDDASEQHSGRPDDGAARLQQQMNARALQRRQQRLGVLLGLASENSFRGLSVGDSQSAAGVDVANIDALGPQANAPESATRSMASRKGSTSVICDPM